jgi:hypothetical protein
MALTSADLAVWRASLETTYFATDSAITQELLRDVGDDPHEIRLHNAYIGHLRTQAIVLSARIIFLSEAIAVVGGGGSHPAQYMTPPVSEAIRSTPAKPPPYTTA